jgi:lambda repressor-like predicted transcriptional regulator
MHPEQIKAAMRMNGVTPAALADELRVARSTMSQVISGRAVSARIRESIARVTNLAVEVLWPPTGKPVLRRVKPKAAAQPHRQAKGTKS